MSNPTRRLSWQLRSRHIVGNDVPFKQDKTPTRGVGARKPSRPANFTNRDNGFTYSRAPPGDWDQQYYSGGGGGGSPVQKKANTPAASAPDSSTPTVDFLEVFFRFCFNLLFFFITFPMRLMGYAMTFFLKMCVYWVLLMFTIVLTWVVLWNMFLFIFRIFAAA